MNFTAIWLRSGACCLVCPDPEDKTPLSVTVRVARGFQVACFWFEAQEVVVIATARF